MRFPKSIVPLLALLSWSASSFAQPTPPKAAFDACASLKAGESCSFTLEARSVQGVCRADGSQVACAPGDMPEQGHRGPPAEAIAACASLRAGDTCSFGFGARAMEGICRARPGDSQLACAPKDMPEHGHRHGPPPEAMSACASLRPSDACSFTLESHTVDGICRAGADGSGLACAPKDMPEHGQHRGPPPEAVSACSSLRVGDACAFGIGSRPVDGTCRAAPDGSQLACAPRGMPPPEGR